VITHRRLKFPFVAHAEHLFAERPRSKSARTDTATKLIPGDGFLLAMLLSLGLWITIWKAVSSVPAGWLG
jgi:hypothetical protein